MPATIIQARFGETEYPIGRLILERARALGLSRSELVLRLGYKNLSAGHRTLTALLMTGRLCPTIAPRLAEALEVEPELLDQVLLATARHKNDRTRALFLERERIYREAFRPHLRVETEREIPSPIFIAALYTSARLRVIRTRDETWSASPEKRDQLLKSTIREHFSTTRGFIPAFGRIAGYTAVLIAGYGSNFGYRYDVNGNATGRMRQVERLREAVLGKKRRDTRLTGLLSNTPIGVIEVGDKR